MIKYEVFYYKYLYIVLGLMDIFYGNILSFKKYDGVFIDKLLDISV